MLSHNKAALYHRFRIKCRTMGNHRTPTQVCPSTQTSQVLAHRISLPHTPLPPHNKDQSKLHIVSVLIIVKLLLSVLPQKAPQIRCYCRWSLVNKNRLEIYGKTRCCSHNNTVSMTSQGLKHTTQTTVIDDVRLQLVEQAQGTRRFCQKSTRSLGLAEIPG